MELKKNSGVFVCSGCGIGGCFDVAASCRMALEELKVAVAEEHPALCSVQGYDYMVAVIEEQSLDSVVIAACSPRFRAEVFVFPEKILLERVNLREQVAWCFEPGHEDTQMAADDAIRIGVTKAATSSSPEPYTVSDISDDILVVGGGVTGMTAAIEGARAGYTVHLVEQEARLGGKQHVLYKQYPSQPSFLPTAHQGLISLADPVLERKLQEISGLEKIHVYTSTKVASITGQPGTFDVTLQTGGEQQNGGGQPDARGQSQGNGLSQGNGQLSGNGEPGWFTRQIRVGSVVAAMGWKPYDPNKLSHLGYGKTKQVITIGEFEQKVKEDPALRLPGNILFIQCAGSRDKEHLPYCSSYCCSTSLKQAKYIRELSPDSSVFIVYRDIRTPGLAEAFYREVQDDDRIFFTKGVIGEVLPTEGNHLESDEVMPGEVDRPEGGEAMHGEVDHLESDKMMSGTGPIRVTVTETLLGEEITLEVDLIILATGMVPAGTDGLNLGYRLGKGLPDLNYGFSDSHFICFPYETRRTGIYAAGCVRAPMDIASCEEDAAGAVFKAIQCIEATKRGQAVHPRSGDKSFPALFMDRCTDCKRCTEECPFGMYDETAKGTPLPNPSRCRRCGICLGSCPERVISFSNFSVNSVSAMIKSVGIPDEFEEKPRILVFVCENDAYPALDMAGTKRLIYSPFVRIIPVRCLGSINKVWISDALSCGYDGILQIGCKPGDDYQCHFIHGSELTETRGENFGEALQTMMLEPERIRTAFVEITDYEKITEIINDYVEEVEVMGPNPFKGM